MPKENISTKDLDESVTNSLNSGSLEFNSIANYDSNHQVYNDRKGSIGFSKDIKIPTTVSSLLASAGRL